MPGPLQRATALKRRIDDQISERNPLSARETESPSLVAHGMTNQEIAARLFFPSEPSNHMSAQCSPSSASAAEPTSPPGP